MHAGQTDEHEIAFHVGLREIVGWKVIAISRGEHSKCMLRHGFGLRENVRAILFGEGANSATCVEVGAEIEQRAGCAIEEGTEFAIGHPANDGAAFAIRVEGDLVMLRQVPLDALACHAALMPAASSAPSVGSPRVFQRPFPRQGARYCRRR